MRGGYGISYNAGSYASISRQMVAQPPFAVTDTRLGTAVDPLTLANAFEGSSGATTTNNYGVDKDYALGVVQTWNADVSRDLQQVWNLGANYTYTRGGSLDIVRAPNRGPSGLRIEGVQPFLWQSSEGGSELHAGSFRLRRRPVKGIGFGASYTIAKSRDNASTIGGGGTVVAQDDQNLDAEWGLSSFDRRHQFNGDINLEFPFGENRPWLNKGGFWAALLENWRGTASFVWQSGTPYTPRVQAAAADVARGTSNSLRANYNGESVQINDPTIDLFFNTAAFSIPATGTFGTASRNMIIGPGNVVNDGRSGSLFFQDDWRKNAALTFSLGIRYEYLRPFEEDERRMVNLDAPSDFTAVAPVMPGEIGPYSGAFPSTLMNADINNVAPRIGFAWREMEAYEPAL